MCLWWEEMTIFWQIGHPVCDLHHFCLTVQLSLKSYLSNSMVENRIKRILTCKSLFHAYCQFIYLCTVYAVYQCKWMFVYLWLWVCWEETFFYWTTFRWSPVFWRDALFRGWRNESVSVCLSAESLGGEIRSCQRWSRCYSTSSHRCSPMQQPTYSISASETTRSKPRFVSVCVCVCVISVVEKGIIVTWMMKAIKRHVLGTKWIPCDELQSDQLCCFAFSCRSFQEIVC